MFLVIGILMTIFALLEVTNKIKSKSKLFYLFSILLLAMLCFRYGQGTDYHEYEVQYSYINISSSYLINTLDHGGLGWYILLVAFKKIGCSFSVFLGIISFAMMSSIIKAINRYSPYKLLSLFILYPTFYLTFFYSAIRQGVVFSVFIGYGIQWLTDKKYIKYYIMVVVLFMIHSSALVLAFIPLALFIKNKKPTLSIIIALSIAAFCGYSGILYSFASKIGLYLNYLSVSISILAIFLRCILFYIVQTLYRATKEKDDSYTRIEDVLYYIYIFGFVLYIMLAFSGTLSQRMTMPMKGIEIILIPILIAKINNRRAVGLLNSLNSLHYVKIGRSSIPLAIVIVILALDVEMIKNINSYLVQGNYYDWVNVFNYQYISIFNKEDIFKYISHFD